MTVTHLKYCGIPICGSQAGQFVRQAAGKPDPTPGEMSEPSDERPGLVTCEMCKLTLALWLQDEAASGLLQVLLHREQSALSLAKQQIELCDPNSPAYPMYTQQFHAAMQGMESLANRWVSWMRQHPVLG
jgi:hypothetical protein